VSGPRVAANGSARKASRPGAGFATAVAIVTVLIAGPAARAISTDPVLFIREATVASGTQTRVLGVDGVFPSEDLVQSDIDVQILLRETTTGTGFVRYQLSVGGHVGSAPELADGFGPEDAAALVTQGVLAPDAKLLLLSRDRIEVTLPSTFPAGPAVAVMFVIHEGTPILSNPVNLVVGAAP